jgi:molecular chaperone GrpE (heat shock protein)
MENDLMEQWDYWRARIAGGDAGSAPRDWFESVVDWLTEKAEDWREKYIICCEDSKLNMEAMKQRAERAEAKLRELAEAAAWRDECNEMAPWFSLPSTSTLTDQFDDADAEFARTKSKAEADYQAAIKSAMEDTWKP